MSAITFNTRLFLIHSWVIVRLPGVASTKLPSRGMNFVRGTMNGIEFQAPLEPDGNGSHWFRVEDALLKATGVHEGDTVELKIGTLKDWPRPEIPGDFKNALAKAPEAKSLWEKITPKAQWEWLRWIRATNRQETRARHLEVACDKLKKGMRRPCCFNSSVCTEPYVSKNGVLLEPTHA